MAYDGIQYSNRVDALTLQKKNAKVVDNILNSRTYSSRLLGRGKPMEGKTYDYPIKVVDSQAGEFFTGLETLNSTASDTLITLSYAHTAFQQPEVSIMVDSFANAGPEGVVPLDEYKHEEAIAEALQKWGNAIYGTGGSSQPLGLGAIVDDGTDVGTIGGQSRTTYTTLKATRTAATSGVWSLTVAATLWDAIIASGLNSEEPNLGVTTKTVWSLHEQLLQPQARATYEMDSLQLPLRGDEAVPAGDSRLPAGQGGFRALLYRGIPIIRDDACTSGNMFFLNERYFEWRGRTVVPEEYRDYLEKVNFGDDANTLMGVGADQPNPPANFGWFHQMPQVLPQQAGQIARLYAIGQVTASQFRRQGRETGITTV